MSRPQVYQCIFTHTSHAIDTLSFDHLNETSWVYYNLTNSYLYYTVYCMFGSHFNMESCMQTLPWLLEMVACRLASTVSNQAVLTCQL